MEIFIIKRGNRQNWTRKKFDKLLLFHDKLIDVGNKFFSQEIEEKYLQDVIHCAVYVKPQLAEKLRRVETIVAFTIFTFSTCEIATYLR